MNSFDTLRHYFPAIFSFSLFLFIPLHFNCNELGVDKVTRSLTSFWQCVRAFYFILFLAAAAAAQIEYRFMYGKTLYFLFVCSFFSSFFLRASARALSKTFVSTKHSQLAHTHHSWRRVFDRYLLRSPISSIQRYICSTRSISKMSSSDTRKHQSHQHIVSMCVHRGSGQRWQRATIKIDVKSNQLHNIQKQIIFYIKHARSRDSK